MEKFRTGYAKIEYRCSVTITDALSYFLGTESCLGAEFACMILSSNLDSQSCHARCCITLVIQIPVYLRCCLCISHYRTPGISWDQELKMHSPFPYEYITTSCCSLLFTLSMKLAGFATQKLSQISSHVPISCFSPMFC